MHDYLILLIVLTVTLSTLAIIVWTKRGVPGARSFSVLMFSLAIWSLGYYFEISSADTSEFVFWASFEYFGILLIPISWLVFVAQFTGYEKFITKRNLLLFSIEPAIFLILVWSNNLHSLVWEEIRFEKTSPLMLGIYNYGVVFWINVLYTYLALLAGSYWLVQFLIKYKKVFRSQLVALLIGSLATWIFILLYLVDLNPLPHFDLTILGFTITGIAASLALLRYRFLDILPATHSTLIEDMSDGLIVLDGQNRIIEVNPAAEKMFNRRSKPMLGLAVNDALSDFPEFIETIQNISDGSADVALSKTDQEKRCIYELRISPLHGKAHRVTGKMIVLRDITERIETTETLKRREEILVAIRFAATQFMKGSPWEEITTDFLKGLGEVVQASRVYIFENHHNPDSELLTRKIFEWTAQGIQAQLNNPELKSLPIFQAGYSRWHQLMNQGLPIYGIVEAFPDDERVLLERLGILSLAVIPIFVGDIFWGCMGFDDCISKRKWSNAEIDALEAAASTLGSSIQRQQMEEQLRERVAFLDALYQTSLEIAAPHDLPVLLRTIVARAVDLIGATSGGLYLCDHDRMEAICMVSYQTKRDYTGSVFKFGEGAAGMVAESGHPLVISDYRNWEGRAKSFDDEQPFLSVVSAPMIWQDRVLGVIHVLHNSKANYFSEKDLNLLYLFANQAAVALQNAQLLEAMQLRARRLAIINQITHISLEMKDQGEMLENLADQLGELLNADSSFIVLWDSSRKQVIPKAAFGPYKKDFTKRIFPPGESSFTKAVIETSRTVISEDYANSPLVSPVITKQFPEIRSLIALPLTAGTQKFGAALIAFHKPHHFTNEETELCEQTAAQVALAMDKTRLIESAQRRADELDALRATISDISSELDIPLLLQAILERAVTLLNATGGDLGLCDPIYGDILIVVSHNLGKDFTGTRMNVGEGAMGLAVETNQVVVIPDYMQWEERSPQYTVGNWHAAMAVPLRSGGRVLGALGVVDTNPNRTFIAEDQRLLMLFAHQAAIAIENARLFAAQKQRAKELGILYESSASIAKSLDLSTVCQNSARQLSKAVNSTSAFILSCDLDRGTAKTLAEYFSPEAVSAERVSEINITYNLIDFPRSMESLRLGKTQVIQLSDPDIDPKDREELIAHGVKSALEVPMIVTGRVLGFADIWDSREERIWSEEEIRVCRTLANQAAIAMDNARLYNEILQIAATDMLTGIYNRRGLFDIGKLELKRACRYKHPLTAIMLDIDHFKRVNDTHNHTVGDQVLKALVKTCQSDIRETDILGRYGGEEFVILLPETDCRSAFQVAERLRLHIAGTPIATERGLISITVSMGIACVMNGIVELATLLDRADSAMYKAKRKGRNQIGTVQPIDEVYA